MICFSDSLRIAKDPNAVPCEPCQRAALLTTVDKIGIAARALSGSQPKGKTVLEECMDIMRAGHTVQGSRPGAGRAIGVGRFNQGRPR